MKEPVMRKLCNILSFTGFLDVAVAKNGYNIGNSHKNVEIFNKIPPANREFNRDLLNEMYASAHEGTPQ